MQAVLTQRRLEVGPLSAFIVGVLVVDFAREPLEIGSWATSWIFSAELASIVKSTQQGYRKAWTTKEACLSGVETLGALLKGVWEARGILANT